MFLKNQEHLLSMDRGVFERELVGYIARLRKAEQPSWLKQFWARKSKTENHSEHLAGVLSQPQPVRVEQPVEVPVREDPAVQSEYDEDKKGVFRRVAEWVVAGSPEKHDAVAEPEASSVLLEHELKNDLKEVARISIAAFRQLPAHKIRALKESDDFARFRDILKKHGLSRE